MGVAVAAAIWLLIMFTMRAGSSRARKFLTAAGAVHVALLLGVLFQGPGFSADSFGLIVLVIGELSAIVMMFRPGTSGYFRTQQRRSRQARTGLR